MLQTKRIQSKYCPEKGQIVHLKDKGPRGTWKIGKIEELITSRDGQIRSAKVRLSSGIIVNRPLNLLYPLETSIPYKDECDEEAVSNGEVHEDNETENESNEVDLHDIESKPKRLAGVSAREKLSKLLRHRDNKV